MTKHELIQKYPTLFPGGEPECGVNFEVGWSKLLDDMCQELVMTSETCIIIQVKQKLAKLRVNFVEESKSEMIFNKVNDIISKYEELSMYTCELCGGYGKKYIRGGYMMIKCASCEDIYG